MIKHYFPKTYPWRVAEILESFSLLHGQRSFELSFQKIRLAGPQISSMFTDLKPPDQFKVSNAAAMIKCGLLPAPPIMFSLEDRSVVKGELVSLLASLLTGEDSIYVLKARVSDYPGSLLSSVSSMLEDADPGPLSSSEVLKQEMQVKAEYEIVKAGDLEEYLEKISSEISKELEARELKADWS